MVSHTRLKSFLTGLALYTMAAALIGYFGVNAYTGKYGLHAQAALDQEMIALTSELARLKQERIALERFQLEFAHPRDLVRVTVKRN
jgi:cell division protein FtsB